MKWMEPPLRSSPLMPRSYPKMTADIVTSFLRQHPVATADLPDLIRRVHTALVQAAAPPDHSPQTVLKPAVPIRKSITPDYLICLNDGKHVKSLKRHLRATYNMTPDDYRTQWGLDPDYPMVAPGYARERSTVAKEMRLGLQRRRAG